MKRLGVAAAIVADAYVPGDVAVEDGVVVGVGLAGGRSGLAIPGMVDLQVNGYAGVDFLTEDGDGWLTAARAMARDGVTAFVANLITSSEPMSVAALRTASSVTSSQHQTSAGARLLGAHLEGPFLAPGKSGTHPPAQLRRPDVELVRRLRLEGPVVGLTLAPELAGAVALIEACAAWGLLVSLGHSEASSVQSHAGFDAGARTVTHIFNAMTVPTAREPGLAGVALIRSDVAVQVICDGVHVTDDTIRLVLAAAGDRVVLVTDALSAAGAADGCYRLGEVDIVRSGVEARRGDGTLAGSVLTMAVALRRALSCGASVEHAVAAATTRPASLLGREDLGCLRPGDPADITILDDSFEVSQTLLGGTPTR